ncbi:hypothetical protein PFISCL1PPCAC_5565 [Pristionchus fissidentatus]|uniref:Uncharacterized protein n=1 Tax=Pristionchus fissidentatus TaxID=1538716 RepID=A0AAV5V556_9BILA|nr:hypothetical protein PFISCL1PPCAC_5565 [Pristionchus fissidentatus]
MRRRTNVITRHVLGIEARGEDAEQRPRRLGGFQDGKSTLSCISMKERMESSTARKRRYLLGSQGRYRRLQELSGRRRTPHRGRRTSRSPSHQDTHSTRRSLSLDRVPVSTSSSMNSEGSASSPTSSHRHIQAPSPLSRVCTRNPQEHRRLRLHQLLVSSSLQAETQVR